MLLLTTYPLSLHEPSASEDVQTGFVHPAAVAVGDGHVVVFVGEGLTVVGVDVGDAVSVGMSYRPPQLLLHFDRSETQRVAGAADTGFTPFVTTLCLMLPGGRRLVPVNAACVVGTTTSYSRLMPIFKDARRRGRCVRISYPVGFPLPNPAPYSRVEACR